MFWAQRKFTKTIPLDAKLNIGITRSSAGHKQFSAYVTAISDPVSHLQIFESHILPSHESDDNPTANPSDVRTNTAPPHPLDDSSVLPPNSDAHDAPSLSAHEDIMRWHHRLNHLPFARMKRMASIGLLPKRILDTPDPVCAAC
jgi:hypothetical protein